MPANKIAVSPGKEGRIDRFLSDYFPDYSRTYFKKLVSARSVLVDAHPVTPHHMLKQGQVITIDWPSSRPKIPVNHFGELPFPVVFEDEELLIINKPAGLLCHPAGAKGRGESVVDLLSHKLSAGGWPDDLRPGLVHRLDKDTSGILIFAKNPDSHALIAKQFQNRQVKKLYLAIAHGWLDNKKGTLEGNIARNPFKRNQFFISDEGRHSVTNFVVLEKLERNASFLELNPLTGRTHQLRVQLAAFGHPIVGDFLYGGDCSLVKRQMLHAASIEFQHPEKKKKMFFEAPMPSDFQAALKVLRLSA